MTRSIFQKQSFGKDMTALRLDTGRCWILRRHQSLGTVSSRILSANTNNPNSDDATQDSNKRISLGSFQTELYMCFAPRDSRRQQSWATCFFLTPLQQKLSRTLPLPSPSQSPHLKGHVGGSGICKLLRQFSFQLYKSCAEAWARLSHCDRCHHPSRMGLL